jgi:dihydroorotase/N-acyl-D-amino-acid deacylase
MRNLKKWGVFVCMLLFSLGCKKSITYDVVILNGQVFDGSQDTMIQQNDIGIIDNQIITLGKISSPNSKRIIDATNLVVSPGFIDLHVHLEPIFELSDCESHIRQGVTTSLGGPDGRGPLPFGDYLDSLAQLGVGMNVGFLAGHNSIRSKVMNLDNRAPTNQELKAMKVLVAEAMEEGAFGISTGLKYLPGNF